MKSKTFITSLTRLLPALLALCAASLSLSVHAQAAASGPVESIKAATKATTEAGGKVVDGTKKMAGKVRDAISSAGEKIDAKVPRTEAYKKMEAKEKMEAKQAAAGKPVAAKKKKRAKKTKAKPAA